MNKVWQSKMSKSVWLSDIFIGVIIIVFFGSGSVVFLLRNEQSIWFLLIFITFLALSSFYNAYDKKKKIPRVTLDNTRIEVIFNSINQFYNWSEITQITLMNNQISPLGKKERLYNDCITLEIRDKKALHLWVNFYANGNELRYILEQAKEKLDKGFVLQQKFDFETPPTIMNIDKEKNLGSESFVNYNSGFFNSLSGMIHFITLLMICSFSFQAKNIEFRVILTLTINTICFIPISYILANYFSISNKYLVIQNSIWFWRKKVYSWDNIKGIILSSDIESNSFLVMKIIMKDYTEKAVFSGNLKKKDKKSLEFELIKMQKLIHSEAEEKI